MRAICAFCLSKDRILTPLQDEIWEFFICLLRNEEIQYFQYLRTKFSLTLCWECRTKMYKLSQFAEIAQKSLRVLENYLPYSTELETECLSKLSKTKVNIEEFPPKGPPDLEIEVEIKRKDDKSKSGIVKQESEELVKEEECKLLSNQTNEYSDQYDNDDIKEENDDDQLSNNFDNLHNTCFITPLRSSLYVGPLEASDNKRNGNRTKTKLKYATNVVKVKTKVVKQKIIKNVTKKSPIEKEVFDKFTKVVMTEEEMQKNREIKRNTPNYRRIANKCDSCVLGFNKKETFDEHVLKKHHKNNGDIVCPVCQIRFTNAKTMDRHKNKHYTYYTCKLCKYETVNVSFAITHCTEKHKDDTCERIHCRECTEVCKSLEDLSQHMQTQHLVICNECGDKFKGKDILRAHLRRIHARAAPFSCASCPRTFRSAPRLHAHAARHGDRTLSYCAPCDQQFKNIYVYRRHLITSAQHVRDTYQCSECDKKFATKVYLKNHFEFFHLKLSKFKCPVCDTLVMTKWKLKNHMQLYHGAERPRQYACADCGKKFFTSATLKSHQLIHSSERLFMCAQCGHTFKQRPSLYTHIRRTHNTAPQKTY